MTKYDVALMYGKGDLNLAESQIREGACAPGSYNLIHGASWIGRAIVASGEEHGTPATAAQMRRVRTLWQRMVRKCNLKQGRLRPLFGG